MKAPLDLESLVDFGMDNFQENYFWPSSSDLYDKIAMENLEFLFKVHDEAVYDKRDLMRLAFRQMFLDFNYFSTNYLDVFLARNAGREPVCGQSSRIYKSIISDNYSPAPPSMALDSLSLKEKLKNIVRPIVKKQKMLNEINKAGSNVCFTNGLSKAINEYCRENDFPVPVSVPNYFFSKAPAYSFREEKVLEEARRIASGWRKIIEERAGKMSPAAFKYMKSIAEYYLSWAWRDMFKKEPFPLNNTVFIVGTGGGYWNRMIGFKVQKAGGKVIRMDHGGERPFYVDRWWGVNEFAFCDIFVTFSREGAKAIKTNLDKEYRSLLDCSLRLKVSYLQNSSFNVLRDKQARDKLPDKIKSIMFVPTGFQGEFNSTPSFTAHDVPYASFQIQILQALRKSGLKTLYKQAPKAYVEALFKPEKYGAETVGGYLSECLALTDAFLFTFIGTAFCEAMCTDKPVLLIQAPPLRPMLGGEKEELGKACRIIKCSADKDNRLVLNEKELLGNLGSMTGEELKGRKQFRDKWLLH